MLTKASDAKKANKEAERLERIKLAVIASQDNNGINTSLLAKNLSEIEDLKYINGQNQEVDITENTEIKLTGKFILDGNKYKISEEGKVTTKNLGVIDNEDINESPTMYYGKYVTNYNSLSDSGIKNVQGQLGKWQIFLADDTNIYLIASNAVSKAYVSIDYNYNESLDMTAAYNMWFSNILSKYNKNDVETILGKLSKQNQYHEWLNTPSNLKNNDTEKIALSMLDTDKWNEYMDGTTKKGYRNSTYASYVIGGPTLEMFCKSYNPTHAGYDIIPKPKNDSNGQYYSYGYKVQKGGTVDNGAGQLKDNSQTEANGDINSMHFRCNYWIASPTQGFPSNVMLVTSNGEISNCYYTEKSVCFRPIVCLKSNVHLIENNNGTVKTYELELD